MAQQGLAGKTAIVTGASSGIGRAIAIALAEAGADLLVHARHRRAEAEELARRIMALGRASHVLTCDLAETAELPRFVEEAFAWRGDAQIWVNNAGADVLTGQAAGWSFEQKLHQLWRVDVLGTITLSRDAGKRMRDAARTRDEPPGSRVILNIGWDQAEFGMAGDSGEMFAATKGAIMAFTRSLACSLAPRVRVNCVAPGWIKTAWGERASDEWQQRACRESLLGRWGTPEDVARVTCFLASPAAEFITGQAVPVNGGFRHA